MHTRRRPASAFLLPLALAAAVAGCAGAPSTPRAHPARAAASTPSTPAPAARASRTVGIERADASVSRVLETLGADATFFHSHITTLSNPFFEGREPGLRGNELAAEYIANHFSQVGLVPAFDDGSGEYSSFHQHFTVPGEMRIERARVDYGPESGAPRTTLEVETDFNPLAFGTNGAVDGPLVFAGYSIAEGVHGYSSFGPHDDLTGKIAVILRFEPMNDKGASLWSETDSWTDNASLIPKAEAAASRGAAAVIIVNPPGADDERVARLMALENSRLRGRVAVPAIMLTTEAADDLVRAADAEGRSLMDLRRLADSGAVQTLDLPNVQLSMEIHVERDELETTNVGAILPGRGDLSTEYIVIGAHYDHIGYGRNGTLSPDRRGEVHPGADDNASGTSGLLFLAQRLSDDYESLPRGADARSILFLAFSAEEMGLLGARHFVKEPSIDLTQVQVMMNMDMIGRLREDGLEVSGVATGVGMKDLVAPVVESAGVKSVLRDSGGMPSDQAAFLEKDVPVLGFFTGTHREYHTVFDVASTINHAGAAAVANLAGDIALRLATHPEKLAYNPVASPGRRMGSVTGSRVRLGIAPGNYADNEPGVVVGAVSDGTTAAKAGMMKGDRIIRWGGEELANVESMMERLSGHKPGDKVQVVVLRDGQELTLDLVMQSRAALR